MDNARKTRDWYREQKQLNPDKDCMPGLVSWLSPRDRAVVPFYPGTLDRAYEARDAAYRYAQRALSNATEDNSIRLAYLLMTVDSAAVAQHHAQHYKEHFKERVNILTDDFDTLVERASMDVLLFRMQIGAEPYTVSGEWYFDELLKEAQSHIKMLRTWYERLTPKQSRVPKTVVLPRINAQQSTKRYAPGQLPLPIPAQVSAPPQASAQPEPQYSASVAAGGS